MFSGDLGDALVNVSINVCFFLTWRCACLYLRSLPFTFQRDVTLQISEICTWGVISVEYTFVGEIVGSRHSYLTCHPS